MAQGVDEEPVQDSGSAGNLATNQVLSSANIRRIICVDDGFTDSGIVDTDAILSAVRAGEVAAGLVRQIAYELLGDDTESYIAEDNDFEAQAQWLARQRSEISEDMWARLGDAAPEDRNSANTAQDPEALQQLVTFADELGIEFVPLNLNGWRNREDELLAMDGCALILFDRNLSDDGGAVNEGVGLLKAAANKYPPEKAIGVLFTHSVGADGEFAQWQVMTESDDSIRDRVLVIAKQRIRSDLLAFASGIKMAVLAPRLRRVANRIQNGFAEKAEEAAGQLGKLSPHLLHTLLVTSAESEGSWGPDGLMTIASADLRLAVEAYVREDAEVRADALQIRELSRETRLVVLPAAEVEEYDRINRMRVFDGATHVNELRLPIDTGDIFAFFDPKRSWDTQVPNEFWIIVLQRCDLAVRGDGKRAYSPQLMPLLRIATPSGASTSSAGSTDAKRVKLFSSPLADVMASEVRLAERRFAPSIALDACAFHADGVSRLDVTQKPAADGLSPAWCELLRRADVWATKKLELYERICKEMTSRRTSETEAALCGAVTGALKDISGFSSAIEVKHKRIVFGVRRIARLREPYIQDVMERLSALSSRTAIDAALQADS